MSEKLECSYLSCTGRRACENAISMLGLVARFPWDATEIDLLIEMMKLKKVKPSMVDE